MNIEFDIKPVYEDKINTNFQDKQNTKRKCII